MGRIKKSTPKTAEAEDVGQEVPEADETPTSSGPISKAAAVRDAIAKGNDSPDAGVGYLHSVYGIVMTKQMFSSYKSQQKARDAEKGAKAASKGVRGAGRGPRPLVESYVAPPEKPRKAGEPDVLLALEDVKELVGQFGADRVKRMVDLIG